ncbi:hypothetical protein ISF_08558 [Cordyceps fumosorosea ARSEF 2679]|uniref:Uncharacterized protein n=1 Tax=Cordyceps fumosorosea (strain ARSEF 2679) TaxID=1081104 RepID=A0A167M346_CORFA|nr:hypothetical protein ISF_08558 [Cordyceps fumosorosea ARSEF 2679]OAA53856.1 hypothetical protein ISF_08558 [Cordyceps fumosorosea ARSEF 2679]
MGNPSDLAPPYKDSDSSQPTTPLGEAASSISMHRPNNPTSSPPRQPYFDHDFDDEPPHADDDLPPLYSDHDHDAVAVTPADLLIPPGTPPLAISPFRSPDSGTTYFLDRRLDTDPAFLQQQLEILAAPPPRPLCRLRGTHSETRRRDDKDEQETVVDFDVEVDLTAVLYTDARAGASWRRLITVDNREKVRRGTVLARRAPGSGLAEASTPTVQEWCHRYCASVAGLKVFALERRVIGWDFDHLQRKLVRLVRDTNYQGRLHVDFPVRDARVEIHNECRTSRWRLTRWIVVVFCVTLTFLLAWPWLFFRTKRWETVRAEWPLRDARTGRYASLSEDEWFNMWARTIREACLARKQGVLDQGALRRQQEVGAGLGGLPGVMQAGVDAMGVVDCSFGWGGDDDRRGGHSRGARVSTFGGGNRC